MFGGIYALKWQYNVCKKSDNLDLFRKIKLKEKYFI